MKFEIEGQKHNLLLNYDSNILNLFINKSVAIVGSSGILLNKEYGNLIDTHDIIVRFNVARVKGFEKHVGKRTDIRFFNGHAFAGTSDPNRFLGNDPNFVSSLNGEILIVKSWNEKEFMLGTIKTTPQNTALFLNPHFTNYCNQLTGGEATCGLLGVIFMTLFSKNISCFGFNHYKDNLKSIHYWEEIKDAENWKTGQSHGWNKEEQLFQQYIDNKIIKMHR